LRLSEGPVSCPQGIVLVQRGWVPRDPADRLRLPALDTPPGEVQLAGRVMTGLSQVFQLGAEPPPVPASAPVVRQNADDVFWTQWLGQPSLAGAVLQVQAATPSDAPVLLRQWAEPGQGQDKHLAYAAQWFAMAAVVAGLTIWFQIIRPRRQNRHPNRA
jgi:surfeit locus 1 family protein